MRIVCSWCRTTVQPGVALGTDAVDSYGMCRRCLSHNLRRLDVLWARASV